MATVERWTGLVTDATNWDGRKMHGWQRGRGQQRAGTKRGQLAYISRSSETAHQQFMIEVRWVGRMGPRARMRGLMGSRRGCRRPLVVSWSVECGWGWASGVSAARSNSAGHHVSMGRARGWS